MGKHDGDVRQYRIMSESMHADASLRNEECTEEILFGLYHPGGGTSGEFWLRWVPIDDESTPVLMAYSDSWSAMSQFPELLEKLVEWDGCKVSPTMVRGWLQTTTIEDATKRKDEKMAKQPEPEPRDLSVVLMELLMHNYELMVALAKLINAVEETSDCKFGSRLDDATKAARVALDKAKAFPKKG